MSVHTGGITNFVCSHCGVLSQFNVLTHSYSPRENRFYEIQQCQNKSCGKYMIFIYDVKGWGTSNVTYVKFFHYPTISTSVHISIPTDIKDSYIQGMNCLNVASPIGAVTCFRRALQQICKEKGAQQTTLNTQIDEILPDYLQEQAHEIRLWGNLGAHPDELVKDVQSHDAEEIKDLLDSIFDALYITPYKVKERREKRNQTP